MVDGVSLRVFFLPLILGLGALGAVVFFLDPRTGLAVIILFYLSAFVFAASLLTVLGVFFRRGSNSEENKTIAISFRQGILLSFLLLLFLILQRADLFFWWSGLIAVLIVVFLESAFEREL